MTQAASLFADAEALQQQLPVLDPTVPAHRAAVVHAMERLVETFVLPAADLYKVNARQGRFLEMEVPRGCRTGLVRSMLNELLMELAHSFAPDDAVLQTVLEDIGVPPTSARQRSDLFRCWLAETGEDYFRHFYYFLRESRSALKVALQEQPEGELAHSLRWEKQQLQRLGRLPLTAKLEEELSFLVEMLDCVMK